MRPPNSSRSTLVCVVAHVLGIAVGITVGIAGCSESPTLHLEERAAPEPSMGYVAESEVFRGALWDDGNAEIARYHAEQPFYGAMRDGEAILITVKEPFDLDALVKADGAVAPAHVVDAMKLNEVLTFQTGVYTYRQMASAFFTRDYLHPLKLAISSQEWCGITTKILTVRGGDALLRTFSYFGDEGERADSIALTDSTVFADALPMFVRTLSFDDERPRRIALLDRQLSNRATPPSVTDAIVTIGVREPLTVPAGLYETVRVTVTRDGAVDVFHLDVEEPHALVRWDRADGGTYTLTLLTRAPYWSMHDPENIQDLVPELDQDLDQDLGSDTSPPALEAPSDAVVTLAIAVTAEGTLSVDGDILTFPDLRRRIEGLHSAGVELWVAWSRPATPTTLVADVEELLSEVGARIERPERPSIR